MTPGNKASIHTITFDPSCYSADAVQRAAYTFGSEFSCLVSNDHDGPLRCEIRFPPETDSSEIEHLIARFQNEVLDYSLRERIRDETREVRNLILAVAFSQTGLVDSER
jgi:His-Xaa-Ser system protein HxsD